MEKKKIKEIVKEKYGAIAQRKNTPESDCCGPANTCCSENFSVIKDEYDHIEGYFSDADLSLGCGLPTEFAGIKPGDHVLDLGSGAGNDCFVARALAGEKGKVTGIDFTEDMIVLARKNAAKLGYQNVEFICGDIENMPMEPDTIDVIISNCVLNLVPDKEKAFREMYRVQKPGGHFSISDIVIEGELPEKIRMDAEMYAGCVSGALQKSEYLGLIQKAGYKDIRVQKSKKIIIPEKILLRYISGTEMSHLMKEDKGIFSITVSGTK